MPKVNEKQADVIEGAVVLANPRGSAPGFLVTAGGWTVVLLPGVPHRDEGDVGRGRRAAPRAGRRRPGLHRRTLKVAAMPESVVETLVKPVYAAYPDVPFTILAAPGEVQLQFAARGTLEEASRVLDRIESDFHKALVGRDLRPRRRHARGRRRRPASREGRRRSRSRSRAREGSSRAASRTIPGSSDYFLGAAVTYANTAKADLVGVSAATLERHGAVSEETAREMALGARKRFGATVGLATTGIAGPGGGTPEKPVGTIHIALDAADGTRLHKRLLLPGERALIRRWTTSTALGMLRKHLLGVPDGGRR